MNFDMLNSLLGFCLGVITIGAIITRSSKRLLKYELKEMLDAATEELRGTVKEAITEHKRSCDENLALRLRLAQVDPTWNARDSGCKSNPE